MRRWSYQVRRMRGSCGSKCSTDIFYLTDDQTYDISSTSKPSILCNDDGARSLGFLGLRLEENRLRQVPDSGRAQPHNRLNVRWNAGHLQYHL